MRIAFIGRSVVAAALAGVAALSVGDAVADRSAAHAGQPGVLRAEQSYVVTADAGMPRGRIPSGAESVSFVVEDDQWDQDMMLYINGRNAKSDCHVGAQMVAGRRIVTCAVEPGLLHNASDLELRSGGNAGD